MSSLESLTYASERTAGFDPIAGLTTYDGKNYRKAPVFASDPRQEFHRSPDPHFVTGKDASFVENSTQVVRLFIEYFNNIDPTNPSGANLRKTMDAMRQAYAGGGQFEYRHSEINFRASQMRRWLTRNFGATAMRDRGLAASLSVYKDQPAGINETTDGIIVPLPGVPSECSPVFAGSAHYYPTLDDATIELFYNRLSEELCRFVACLIDLEEMKPAGKYWGKLKSAFDTLIDFGRLAAAFRQYRNGNWSLYGPMINEMVRRLGFNIDYPGYLDLMLQGATEESLKQFFPVALAYGLPFFSVDGENPILSQELNRKNMPAASRAISLWQAQAA